MTSEQIVALLRTQFLDKVTESKPLLMRGTKPGDQIYVRIEPPHLIEVMRFLKENAQSAFEQLCDVTCVDYLNFPQATDRYGVIYSLLSITHGHRIWVKSFVNDPAPRVPSITSIWPGADWMEREVFDMFGIEFDDHPDLRRILTWDDFKAFPLRKDYPLRGKGERENYPVIHRDDA
jgi:NADH-quinone oxidoreductase subunit C